MIPAADYGFEFGSVTAADVNNDGKMDLVIIGQSHISVLLGKGDGTFQAQTVIDIPSATFPGHTLAMGDFNGDGKPDIAFSAATPPLTPGAKPTSFGILFGNGDGTFQPLQTQDIYTLTSVIAGVLAADLNGDHKTDIVAIGYSGVGVYLNNGNGVFTTGNVYPVSGSSYSADAAIIADLRGKGVNDILVSKYIYQQPQTLTVLLGNGDGTFVPSAVPLHDSNNSGIAVGDFDGDGKLDVAVQEVGALEILHGLGDGTFDTSVLLSSSAAGSSGASTVTAADMGGGGVPDLVGTGLSPIIFPNTGGARISFTSNANPAMYGQTITLSATVQPTVPGVANSSGTVSISDGTTLLATPTLNSQAASLSTTFAVGTHSIHARFSGDDNLIARSAPAITEVVNKAPTTIALVSSSASVVVGREIVFGTSVTPATSGTLSGIATLHDSLSVIASAPVDASGHATFGAFVLSPGQHSISVTYGGDLNYEGGSSTTHSINVIDFALTTPRSSRTSRSGVSGKAKQVFALEISSTSGELQSVHLTCPNLPSGFACQFSPQDFSLNGTQQIEAVLVQSGRAARLGATHAKMSSVQVLATANSLQRTITVPLP